MSDQCNPLTDLNCAPVYVLGYAIPIYPSDTALGVSQIVLFIYSFNFGGNPTAYAFYASSDADIRNLEQQIYSPANTFKLTPGVNTITKPNHNIIVNWTGQIPTANYSNLPFTVTNNGTPVSVFRVDVNYSTPAGLLALKFPGLASPGSSTTPIRPITPFPTRPAITPLPITHPSSSVHVFGIFGFILLFIVIILILSLLFRPRPVVYVV